MRVTRITKQQKNSHRYSVYVDEKYSFSLDEFQLAASGIVIGKDYTTKQIEDFATESQFGKMYERVLNYVLIRPRSRIEVKQYLERTFLYPKPKLYLDKSGQTKVKKRIVNQAETNELIERALERLDDKGYLNDRDFTRRWLDSRSLNKPMSQRALRQELIKKGISEQIIATELQNVSSSDEDNLQKLINKKRRLTRYQDDKKLIAYLMRQGFNYDDIVRLMKDD